MVQLYFITYYFFLFPLFGGAFDFIHPSEGSFFPRIYLVGVYGFGVYFIPSPYPSSPLLRLGESEKARLILTVRRSRYILLRTVALIDKNNFAGRTVDPESGVCSGPEHTPLGVSLRPRSPEVNPRVPSGFVAL